MAYNKETEMYEGYIYKIYNNINNKIYIGQTIRTISERWAQHKSAARTKKDNIALHIAMMKHGIDMFGIECIEKHSFDNIENLYLKLNKREVFYINMYKSKAPNGYNISNGRSGVCGVNCREIISYDPYKKETCFYTSVDEASIKNGVPDSNIISCCQGKKYSISGKIFKYKEDGICEEDIKKYFEAHPIITQYNLKGEKINIFYSSLEAAEYLKENNNLSQSISMISKNIMGCCRGDRQTAYRYVWRRMDDDFDKYPLKSNYPRNTEKDIDKPIDVYTISGVLIGSFSNVKVAFKSLGLTGKQTNQALRCCKGDAISAFDYIWRFQGEPFNKYSCAIVNGTIRINKYTLDGIFVNTYMNYKYAAHSVETTNRKAIADSCKGENHSYRGFLWFYINDKNQPDKNKIVN